MKLSELKTFGRAIVPAAKMQKIDDTLFELILRQGAIDVAKLTLCLPANKKFASQASIGDYSLSTIDSRFLTLEESGLWWQNGTQYKKLYARTREWMDNTIENWRDRAAGTPQWWFREGDTITVIPKPTAAVADSFWIYYGRIPLPMSSEDHYPFGNTVEIAHLNPLSHNIIDYLRWRALEITGEGSLAAKAEETYYAKIALARDHVMRNTTLLSQAVNKETRLKGRQIC